MKNKLKCNSVGQTEGIRCQPEKNARVLVKSFWSISGMHKKKVPPLTSEHFFCIDVVRINENTQQTRENLKHNTSLCYCHPEAPCRLN